MEHLRQLRYICTIDKEKSFSKAAQKHFISQPALSAIVKKLEKQLGYELFDRQTSPITRPKKEKHIYPPRRKFFVFKRNWKSILKICAHFKPDT